jgi:cytoskeletal protein RodZ
MDAAEAGRIVILSDKNSEASSVSPDPKRSSEPERQSLGHFLVSARERRGVSRADAVSETHIPEHYIRMMESNDYSEISDQLYVMPFLRRYASFLTLDPDEAVMRFVREVQKADNAPAPRALSPIEIDRRKPRRWTGIALAAGLVAVIIFGWIAESRHRRLPWNSPSHNPVSDQNASSH